MAPTAEKQDPAGRLEDRAWVSVARKLRPGREREFETATRGMIEAARRFRGYEGAEVFRPGLASADWVVIVRFATAEDLGRWRRSTQLERWAGEAALLTVGSPRVERANGMEVWLTLPSPTVAVPPRWKTAAVSAAAIYPMITFFLPALGTLTAGLPRWGANLVGVAVMMPLMTWVVMPLATRLFRDWLFAPAHATRP